MSGLEDFKKLGVSAPNLPYLQHVIDTSKKLLSEDNYLNPMLFLEIKKGKNIVVAIDPKCMQDKDELSEGIKSIVARTKPASVCFINDAFFYRQKEGETLDDIVDHNGSIKKSKLEKSEAIVYSVTEFAGDVPVNRYMGLCYYKRDHNEMPVQFEDIVWVKNGSKDSEIGGRFII